MGLPKKSPVLFFSAFARPLMQVVCSRIVADKLFIVFVNPSLWSQQLQQPAVSQKRTTKSKQCSTIFNCILIAACLLRTHHTHFFNQTC
jgi:hypothetical protein